MEQKQQHSISKDQSAKSNLEIAEKILDSANILEGTAERIAAAKASHVDKVAATLDTILIDYELDPVVRLDIVNTFKTEYELRYLKQLGAQPNPSTQVV